MTETNTSNKRSLPVLACYLLLFLGLIGLDRWSKAKVLGSLSSGEVVTVIPSVLQFRYVENTGAAFSILSGRSLLLTAVTAAILVAGIVLLVLDKIPGRGNQIALVLMMAGGAGNLIDRAIRHSVVDFIEVLFTDFAVFNVADCFVTVGAAILILSTVLSFIKDLKNGNS